MKITILQGHFSTKDAESLMTQLIDMKIKFHESKISSNRDHEEDVKMRENCIIQLQKDLFEVRKYIKKHTDKINFQTEINLG